MIIDHIRHADFYLNLSPRFAAGFKFLQTLDFDALTPGRNDIEGDSLFVNSQEYETRLLENGKWEAHRTYADIQFIVEGEERIGYAPLESMKLKTEYSPERDVAFYEGDGALITLRQGDFGIYLPQDVHMPCIASGAPTKVKKVVVKVLL